MRMTTVFQVPAISCGHCKAALEGALQPAEGVERAEVDIGGKTLTVSYAPDVVGPARLIEAIEGQGYDVDSFSEVT